MQRSTKATTLINLLANLGMTPNCGNTISKHSNVMKKFFTKVKKGSSDL